ncbi:hypothetical protein LK09_14615 [Microbacterium mangrovi]|uniref:Carbohydrate kinase PfkB domain-containing protein n=1 Tax=Microbacterium mangrovi TaxID=1348253 RepID=A0A0B2A0M8_9MICO|nr:carbohydrate kinase [Microbacterium mangrovi]KHK96571.1 hypothetical protein LK09_14615 [Microbacterium mangrovi]
MTTRQDTDVLVIGEALIDIVETPSGTTEHVGGSPTNVALGLGRLGVHCALLTQLGHDRHGLMVAEHLRQSNVTVLPETLVLPQTSTAIAHVAADGQARYEFDVTWDAFPAPNVVPSRAVHTGSIGAFLQPGAESVQQLLRDSEAQIITFDPNIRPALMPSRDAARRIFETTATIVAAVKMSDEDAAWLYPDLGADAVIDAVLSLGPKLVAVTRGGEGAVIATQDHLVEITAPTVSVVDTVGAGDTFMASLIQSLLGAGIPNDRGTLRDFGEDAVRAAAITVSRAGADLPWASETRAALLRARSVPVD